MNFSVFEPLSRNEETLIASNVACFFEIENYDYRKKWREVGNFTLAVPAITPGIKSVHTDMIIFVDEGGSGSTNDCLIINDVKDDGTHVVFTGTDLKGLLGYRVTLFPPEEIEAGTYGFDVRQGSTGSIIAGYIDYNCISSSDERRNIPGLNIGSTAGGLENDTYMSRLQPISDVVTTMCKNADIGWDITFSPSAIDSGYVFSLVEGADRTNATGHDKCVFANYLYNADTITKEEKTSERRNVIWTVNGSDTDKAVVTSIYKGDQYQTSGFYRRETVLTANCDIDLTEKYVDSKTADMVDKTQMSFELVDPTLYGRKFNIGDKVTLIKDGREYDKRVIEVVKSYNAQKRTVTASLGDIPTKKYAERTAADLNSRADDVKELALENAATKKSLVDDMPPSVMFCIGSPTMLGHFEGQTPLVAKEGDICFSVDCSAHSFPVSGPFIIAVYKYTKLPDNTPEPNENEESSAAPSANINIRSLSANVGDERTVSSISVQTAPTKTEYARGEELDLTGGVLLVTYSDGNITTVDMTDPGVTTSGYDAQKNGEQTVTVSYSGQSSTFTVSVEVYKWELIGKTLSIDDIISEINQRNRRTNGMYV